MVAETNHEFLNSKQTVTFQKEWADRGIPWVLGGTHLGYPSFGVSLLSATGGRRASDFNNKKILVSKFVNQLIFDSFFPLWTWPNTIRFRHNNIIIEHAFLCSQPSIDSHFLSAFCCLGVTSHLAKLLLFFETSLVCRNGHMQSSICCSAGRPGSSDGRFRRDKLSL